MRHVSFFLDGWEITAKEGDTVLAAALRQGFYIPHLCYHPDLEPFGGCRVCTVEIEGRGLAIACKTPVTEGLRVRTETSEVEKVRRTAVELMIASHSAYCLACAKNGQCKLQDVANYVGIKAERLGRLKPLAKKVPVDRSNPFFERDLSKCILCGICVRTCEEIVGVGAIDFAFRGFATKIATSKDRPIVESACVSCGECVARCPVGALVPKDYAKPMKEIKTVCPFCGCGCTVYLGVRGNQVVSARGDGTSPVNQGRLCVKGRFGYKFIYSPERLKKPLVKYNGEFREASWDEALELVARKLENYKGDQFALIASAKCTNEDSYLLQKFARAVMGTNNVDHCARLCHAPSVVGLLNAIGSGAMSNPIGDIRGAACLLAVGTNTTEAHPIIGYEIVKAVRNGAKLIVVNPQRIDLCRLAHMFLQIRPGSDVALIMGMCRVIVDEGLQDTAFVQERCEGFEEFRQALDQFTLDRVEAITGVPKEQIIEAARVFATTKPGALLWSMGITQHSHGTDNVLALANLAMLTGNIGKPSSGVNPLRGQNNVQGACDMGCLYSLYPGYQPVTDPAARERLEAAWEVKLSPKPGYPLTEIWPAVLRGEIKALYIVGADPVLTMAGSNQVKEALEKAEFVVCQDIFLNETSKLAHVLLPAVTFAEKDGTFTNTERRVQRVRKVIEPVGDARPDWWIVCELAKRMGAKGFDFGHPSEIMTEITRVTPIYAGITYERLENEGIQWPCPSRDHPGTPMLHVGQFNTPSGKGKFTPLVYRGPAELPDEEYPLVLTTDRSLYHFHACMSRRVEGLNALMGEEFLQINPEDARALGIGDGETVRVMSRRGEVKVKAKLTKATPRGVVCMTFHFAETPTNVLTDSTLDPVAKIPATKVCAVRVTK